MCSSEPVLLTTTQVAKALSASTSSVKRWIDQGHLEAVKSPGGHRRVELNSLLSFAQKTGREIKYEQTSDLSQEELLNQLYKALKESDAGKVHHICQELILAQKQPAYLIDGFLRPAFAKLREECPHPSQRCSVLHRAIFILSRLDLSSHLRKPRQNGSSLTGVFADVGYEVDGLATYFAQLASKDILKKDNVYQLGVGVPKQVLIGALTKHRPSFLWLSASGPQKGYSKDEIRKIIAHAGSLGTKVILFSENTPNELSSLESMSEVFIPGNLTGFRHFLLGMTPMERRES